jgi:Amt family ammonium transporter
LWFGWFGFNAGSALGASGIAVQALGTTTVAAAAAGMVFLDKILGHKLSAMGSLYWYCSRISSYHSCSWIRKVYHMPYSLVYLVVLSNLVVSKFLKEKLMMP